MSTLSEIEAAATALPHEQKDELVRFLTAHLRAAETTAEKARLVHQDGDSLLEAPQEAPPMTPETVKRMLTDWP